MVNLLLAALAGGLNTLSFAPFNWWPLGPAAFAVLFAVWLVSTPRQAFFSGLFFGLSTFGTGISWMYISITTFGGMPPLIAGFCIFVLVVYVSLYPALAGLVQGCLGNHHPVARLAVFMPVTWILFEWLRGWVLSGLPWLSTGYAYLDTPLTNLAPLGGVYLVGLVVLVSTGAAVAVVRKPSTGNVVLLTFCALAWGLGWQLNETAWTEAGGAPVPVAVIQNNVPLMQKWDEEESNRIINDYMRSSREQRDVELVVWPEAAVPDYVDNISNTLWRDMETHPADFIFGVLHREQVQGDTRYYNSVVAVSEQVMIYRKQHLVPFGEYFPAKSLLQPLIDLMHIPMSDFSPWEETQYPLHAAGVQVAVSICYEDAFPGEWRHQVAQAGLLLNVSEDSWFGDSLAPHQRLQMARFRARESERPMVRASNNGLSSLINWRGGIDVHAPQFERHVVRGRVQPRQGETPYVVFGEYPVLALGALLLLLGLIFGRIRYPRNPTRRGAR